VDGLLLLHGVHHLIDGVHVSRGLHALEGGSTLASEGRVLQRKRSPDQRPRGCTARFNNC
jgi:hypothetical protein